MKSALFGGALLLSSAMIAPAALAQVLDEALPDTQAPEEEEQSSSSSVEISGPIGGLEEIVVRGRFIPDVIRANPVVVSVLSAEQIARTGDGDVAAALTRVTGLSVVGGKFVYVRGLGERYSSALLNGLPLPSPEPLRRTVPLDLFPTAIVGSTTVQKTFSPSYPGEFGGGTINITTRSVPDEPFLSVNTSVGGNTETTGELGYTYFGSKSDWTGFDNGTRDIPQIIQELAYDNEREINSSNFTLAERQAMTASLQNASTALIQRNRNIPVDVSASITGATSFEFEDSRLGLFANFGYDNSWRTRGGIQQSSNGTTLLDGEEVLPADNDFRYLTTLNRIVVNGMAGATLDIGEHKIKWTNLFVRDVVKEARIAEGISIANDPGQLLNFSNTSWFERQLIDTQLVAELKFDNLSVNLRGTYAESSREAPYERQNVYAENPLTGKFLNRLGQDGERSTIAFSDLTDEVLGAGIDLAYDFDTDRPLKLSVGYSYLDNTRDSIRRSFEFRPAENFDEQEGLLIGQQRIDFLLSDFNVFNYDVVLRENSGGSQGAPAFDAGLEVNAAYLQIEAELFDGVTITTGVRYEDATQFVDPRGIGGILDPAIPRATPLENDYFLPAATVTWNFYDDMQLRVAASKTIARPQFRELAPQIFRDPDLDRNFFGNPFLTDSEFLNFDVRYEWFFGRDERFTFGVFYKDIDNPIEQIAIVSADAVQVNFANAPAARLIGAEIEVEKYFDLYDVFPDNSFLSDRRIYVNANYTYTDSKLQIGANDTTNFALGGSFDPNNPTQAAAVFTDGAPLTGQSTHLANLQIGLEHPDYLSQQTLIFNYASARVSNRGPIQNGTVNQPDILERPGVMLDFVVRQGIELGFTDLELKLTARNLLNTDFEERQDFNNSQIFINTYERGRSFQVSLGATF